MTQQPHAPQPPTGTTQSQTGTTRTSTGSTEPSPPWDDTHRPAPAGPGLAVGGLVFAGVLMMVNGLLAVLQGISALASDDVYDRIGDYVYKINLTGWGTIMIVLGVVLAGVGYGILKGAWWARITGIFLAALSMVAHFLFLPYAPVWSVITVAVDFFVIWALATAPGSSAARARATASQPDSAAGVR
ncbi:DUF7144 family membrane protein [Streptomyces dysideae]|uniref:DUF7144 domain-containing protein n=1 Tax=Streptomyces dysideae TaxID=909626 RepID=A0A124IFF5_9ACTN|nr:hypothetical protein [Streptomyces dysideae]KUO21290.1 hypothetical protein AQJ91_09985 [Streptomyces dysideae]